MVVKGDRSGVYGFDRLSVVVGTVGVFVMS